MNQFLEKIYLRLPGFLVLLFLCAACTTQPTPNRTPTNQFPERPTVRVKPMLQGMNTHVFGNKAL